MNHHEDHFLRLQRERCHHAPVVVGLGARAGLGRPCRCGELRTRCRAVPDSAASPCGGICRPSREEREMKPIVLATDETPSAEAATREGHREGTASRCATARSEHQARLGSRVRLLRVQRDRHRARKVEHERSRKGAVQHQAAEQAWTAKHSPSTHCGEGHLLRGGGRPRRAARHISAQQDGTASGT